jgi:hypothetical protein
MRPTWSRSLGGGFVSTADKMKSVTMRKIANPISFFW